MIAQAAHVDAETTQHLWLAFAQLGAAILIAAIGAFGLIRSSRAAKLAKETRESVSTGNGRSIGETVTQLAQIIASGQERRSAEHQKLEDLLRQLLADRLEE